MILAAASILERRIYPTEMMLDFFWLVFTKSASTANVDGFVSPGVQAHLSS